LVPGAGADGYPSDGTYYFPNWTPVNSSSPTSITKGTVIVNGGNLTFNLFPNVVTANSGPTIYMGFIPLINAASGGTIDVLSIDLGCYGNSYGKWIGIECKKLPKKNKTYEKNFVISICGFNGICFQQPNSYLPKIHLWQLLRQCPSRLGQF